MASFQQSGILPKQMDKLNNFVTDGAMLDAVYFNI